jgi:NAD-dependent SIR2 family protein deacetylase
MDEHLFAETSHTDPFARIHDEDQARWLKGILKHTLEKWDIAANLMNIEELLELTYSAEQVGFRFPATEQMFADPDFVRELLIWGILKVLRIALNGKDIRVIHEFTRKIDSTDIILTLNYDVLIEEALRSSHKSINYGIPKDYCVNELKGFDIFKGQYVLKLHGSMNWLQCENPRCNKVHVREILDIFSFGGDTFEICPSCNEGGLRPVIVPPTWMNSIHVRPLTKIWNEAFLGFANAESLFVVGYSLPPSDIHVRNLLRFALLKNKDLRISVANPDPTVIERYKTISPKISFKKVTFAEFVKEEI